MFCRICELGCDGAVLEVPRCPRAGEAKGTEAATGFLVAPTKAAELGRFLEADVVVPGAGPGPAGLAAGAPPEGEAESHGRLGMAPLKPEGTFTMAGLAAAALAKEDFLGRILLGRGCLPPPEGRGGAVLLGTTGAATGLSSTCLSSFTAAKETHTLSGAAGHRAHCHVT